MLTNDFLEQLRFKHQLTEWLVEKLMTQQINPGEKIILSDFFKVYMPKISLDFSKIDFQREGIIERIKDELFITKEYERINDAYLNCFDQNMLVLDIDKSDSIYDDLKHIFLNELVKPIDTSKLDISTASQSNLQFYRELRTRESIEAMYKFLIKIYYIEKYKRCNIISNSIVLLQKILQGKVKYKDNITKHLKKNVYYDISLLDSLYLEILYLFNYDKKKIYLNCDRNYMRLNLFNAIFQSFTFHFLDSNSADIFIKRVCALYHEY